MAIRAPDGAKKAVPQEAVPCETVPRDTVPRPARCFSTTPGVAMPHSAEHTMVGRGVVFLPGIPPPLVPLLSQVGYYESKIIVCIQMYRVLFLTVPLNFPFHEILDVQKIPIG